MSKSPLTPVAQQICEKRYFRKDKDGNIIEDWEGLVTRVVNCVCKKEDDAFKKKVFDLIYETKFLPNSPCLVNAGNDVSGLLACNVSPDVEDSWLGMVKNIELFGHIARRGGGNGVCLSQIRPAGSPVFGSTHAKACGPIQHMMVVSEAMHSITQSGFRAMANMATLHISHPDIVDFIHCKQRKQALRHFLREDLFNHFEKLQNMGDEQINTILDKHIANFNISVVVSDKFMKAVKNNEDFDLEFNGKIYNTVKAKELFDTIVENAWNNGDPGLLFDNAVNDGPYKYSGQKITATNPCVTGDTMVSVADGRVAVPMSQLASEDKDVPVYCRKPNGNVTIRMMRRPRISGYDRKILKINISNGHSLRVTENHKLTLSDGTIKEAKDLQPNDSLAILTRAEATFEEIINNWNSKSQNYAWLRASGCKGWKLEHRMIYNFANGKKLSYSNGVIHHRDFNGLNNCPENLEHMSKEAHDELCSHDMIGDKNPMRRAKHEWDEEKWNSYRKNMSKATSGLRNGKSIQISNSDLFSIAVKQTKKAGRKLSSAEWRKISKENGIVSQFTGFRVEDLGCVSQFLTNAAIEAKVSGCEYSGSELREYKKFLNIKTDLNIFFDGTIKVQKSCENCNDDFIVPYYQREIGYCSNKCSLMKINKSNSMIKKVKQSKLDALESRRNVLLSVYTEFALDIGKNPMKKEFASYCKERNIPFRIPSKREVQERKLHPIFDSWKDLQNQAELFNHRVISVEVDGVENVYTGTVDDYHNYYIGHFEEKHNNKYKKFIYINNLQCGEQPLPSFGSCNLASIDISKFYDENTNDLDWKLFRKTIHICVRFLDNVIDANKFPTKEFEKWAKENRPVGLGVMGLSDLLLKMKLAYGNDSSIKFAEKLSKFLEQEAHKESKKISLEKGTPKSCRYDELDYRRNVTLTSIAPTGSISLLAGCSSSIEPIFSPIVYVYNNTGQYEMPHNKAKKSYFRSAINSNTKHEVMWEEHIKMQAAFQKYGSSGISKTINFNNKATKKDIADAYMCAWESKCKGVTIYRDGSKSTQVLNTTDKGFVGANKAKSRPKEVSADIFKTKADGMDWHIIVGKVDENPYEIFAVNGKVDLPDTGIVVKRKRRHYSLIDIETRESIIDNIGIEEEEIHPDISLETRRFSLELRHGIHPKYIIEQIDKSNKYMTSFSKASSRVLKKYVTDSDLQTISHVTCPDCAKKGEYNKMISEAGCWRCPNPSCGFSKCG